MIQLTEETKQKFLEHANREFPREACGLVSVEKGRQKYYECKNIAESDSDFILDPRDYIRVDDLVSSGAGDIVAVVHSHPATSHIPSMADKVGCEQSGVSWHIYSFKSQDWFSFAPVGYKAPLIGRQYKHGVFDCYAAAQDWFKEKLSITLPHYDREPQWWKKGYNLLIDNFVDAGFYEIKDGSIEIGDVIFFTIGSPVVNHCAVYIGNDQVFHQPINRLSSREIYGGWLKKNTRMVIRYKNK